MNNVMLIISIVLIITVSLLLMIENIVNHDILNKEMEYHIGDVILIKSKVMPYVEGDNKNLAIRVSTSCYGGSDMFFKNKCEINDGYVIHPVQIVGFYVEASGRIVYKTVNNLSITYHEVNQNVCDDDIVRRV